MAALIKLAFMALGFVVGAIEALWQAAATYLADAPALGIVFPLFIGLLVPLRMMLERWFKPEHLALLDAEETPEDEEDRAPLL